MDVIVRSNNNPVNDMTTPVSGLINDLNMVMRLRVVKVCLISYRNGFACHKQDKQILGGCLRNQEAQAAVR